MSLIARLRSRRHETEIPAFIARTDASTVAAVRRLLDEPEWDPTAEELDTFHAGIRRDIKRRMAERSARDGAA